MLKISSVKSPEALDSAALRAAVSRALEISEADIFSVSVFRRSIDARRGSVNYVYTLLANCKNEESILAKQPKNVSKHVETPYIFPFSGIKSSERPVIVGMGPAGLFCALALCEAGIRPIIVERGRDVDARTADVEQFWNGGALNTESNVQFGEGGAGTFSDGKLVTGINDARIKWVFEKLVRFGAPEDILWLAAPHVGTDRLKAAVKALRAYLISLGCDVRFESRLADIELSGGAVSAAVIESHGETCTVPTRRLILAPGNGARDTFEMLLRRGVSLSPKGFAIGVRIEHLQADIDMAQYGSSGLFPPSSYKLVEHLANGRAVYSFCVCPGGQVIAAASEEGMTVTNGMSLYARDSENINGALLVSVSPADYPAGALGGVELQRKIERAVFNAAGGYAAPAQKVCDFLKKASSSRAGRVTPSYRPGVRFTNLWDVLPPFICESLAEALPKFGRKIRGFDSPDAVLTAVESRSSSPVRIERDDTFCSVNIRGFYPCGEGAGYAGGITSSAVDGVKCAEAVAREILT